MIRNMSSNLEHRVAFLKRFDFYSTVTEEKASTCMEFNKVETEK